MTRPIEDIERELTEALDKAVARGAKVVRWADGDGLNCGCALMLLTESADDWFWRARARFGWSSSEAWSFVFGFDSVGRFRGADAESYPDLFALGRRLAAKYVDGRAEGDK